MVKVPVSRSVLPHQMPKRCDGMLMTMNNLLVEGQTNNLWTEGRVDEFIYLLEEPLSWLFL